MEKTDTTDRQETLRVYTVSLKGMEFRAYHGCLEEEIRCGNIFLVDLRASYESWCAATDNLVDTPDYGRIYTLVEEVMHGTRRNLLETLASDILDRVHREFPELFGVKVCVKKKNPPVAGPCEWSAVTLEDA